jgi:hypothetical protein
MRMAMPPVQHTSRSRRDSAGLDAVSGGVPEYFLPKVSAVERKALAEGEKK